ncbi:MAG TPA: hypothetical protein VMD59_16370 [Acidimicrobiales bacterium]|nr:hypothetical protein [Acidimicrobiales bacterium]
MADTVHHPYQRGFFYETMPIPAVEENCTEVDAGPLRLVVESRRLTNELLFAALPDAARNVPRGTSFDDSGPTVHVLGASDGLEHLRFDCFEHEPHYHYVMHDRGGNLVCRIDEVAVGDPVAWTIARLRGRLPEMLELAGATELAAAVRAAEVEVEAGVERLVELLERVSG